MSDGSDPTVPESRASTRQSPSNFEAGPVGGAPDIKPVRNGPARGCSEIPTSPSRASRVGDSRSTRLAGLAARVLTAPFVGLLFGLAGAQALPQSDGDGGVSASAVIRASVAGWTLGALAAEPVMRWLSTARSLTSGSVEKIVVGLCSAVPTGVICTVTGVPAPARAVATTGCVGFALVEVARSLLARSRP